MDTAQLFLFISQFSVLKVISFLKLTLETVFLEQESFQFSSLLFIVTLNEFSVLGKVEFTLSGDGGKENITVFAWWCSPKHLIICK